MLGAVSLVQLLASLMRLSFGMSCQVLLVAPGTCRLKPLGFCRLPD